MDSKTQEATSSQGSRDVNSNVSTRSSLSVDAAEDLSWAADAGARADGCAPTIKPGGTVAVGATGGGDNLHPVLGRPRFSSSWSALSTDCYARLSDQKEDEMRKVCCENFDPTIDHLEPISSNFLFHLEDTCTEALGMWNEGTGGHEGPVKFHYHIPACSGPSPPDACWRFNDPLPMMYRGKREVSPRDVMLKKWLEKNL